MRKAVAVLAGIIALSVSLFAAGIVWAYLTEYGHRRIVVAATISIAGAGVAVLAYLLVVRRCKDTRCLLVVILVLAVMLLVPTLSMFYPGKVVFSRFGLTVYGVIPVPVFDITVGPRGGLWFRDKSHFLSFEEIDPLLSPGVDVLIVGTGWHGAASVDPAVEEIEGAEVHILRTPAAFDLFNEYKAKGRTVVLIAHSTC
jgi:hypothetical protein